MADVFTLTPQPVRMTAITRQPIYLSLDMSGYDAIDVELICFIESTATNAAINLISGMQAQTEDGWIILPYNFPAISGTGQQVARVTVASGMLKYLRWDVSALGGATALTLFVRGIARRNVSGGVAFPLTDSASGIGQGQTYGLALQNTTVATSGAANQQLSPGLQLTGQQWNGSASVAVDSMLQQSPISGNTDSGSMLWSTRYNGGSWVKQLQFVDNGGSPQIKVPGLGTYITFGTNMTLAANGGYVISGGDNSTLLGNPGGNRWNTVATYWNDFKVGAQLTAAGTITPTSAIHHVTGATTINIIATTNLPTSGNVFITLIADSAITFGSSASAGGIKVAPAGLTSGKAMTFVFDSSTTFWYAIQGG